MVQNGSECKEIKCAESKRTGGTKRDAKVGVHRRLSLLTGDFAVHDWIPHGLQLRRHHHFSLQRTLNVSQTDFHSVQQFVVPFQFLGQNRVRTVFVQRRVLNADLFQIKQFGQLALDDAGRFRQHFTPCFRPGRGGPWQQTQGIGQQFGGFQNGRRDGGVVVQPVTFRTLAPPTKTGTSRTRRTRRIQAEQDQQEEAEEFVSCSDRWCSKQTSK